VILPARDRMAAQVAPLRALVQHRLRDAEAAYAAALAAAQDAWTAARRARIVHRELRARADALQAARLASYDAGPAFGVLELRELLATYRAAVDACDDGWKTRRAATAAVQRARQRVHEASSLLRSQTKRREALMQIEHTTLRSRRRAD
jgi:hypothetical protein